jgi:hypothetical protein
VKKVQGFRRESATVAQKIQFFTGQSFGSYRLPVIACLFQAVVVIF